MSHVWEETKTAFRYVNHKGKSLIGKDAESRLVAHHQEFFKEGEEDFIPLSDKDITPTQVDFIIPQAQDIPGEIGGKIPGIEAFHNPEKALSSLFAKIHFNTDQFVPKTKESLQNLHRLASYLKRHKNVYVFIAGHCDERASEQYNLALGTKRSNYIRKLLIKEGVDPNQLFTISYGKEKPIASGHDEKAWSKNRRVEFKIYEKKIAL